MSSTHPSMQETLSELYFKESENVITQHKLLSELAKRHYEDEESVQSKTAHLIASKKLLRILQSRKNQCIPSVLLTSTERRRLNYACTFVKVLMDWKFNYKEFYKTMCVFPYFPLESLYRLHVLGIMSLDVFLSETWNNSEAVSVFCKAVISLCSKPEENKELECWMKSGILAYIVNRVFMENAEKDGFLNPGIQKICNLTLVNLMKRFAEQLIENSKQTGLPALVFIWNNACVDPISLHSFCIYALEFIVKHESAVDAMQAISEQHKWTCKNTEIGFITIIEKILTTLNTKEILSIVKNVINSEIQNLKLLLLVVSIYLTCNSDATVSILELADQFLTDAFERNDEKCFIQCLLMVRHVNLSQDSHSQLTYSHWLQKNFGSSTSTFAKDAHSFEFYIRTLTNLVPFEQEQYLKAHIDKPPFIVENCRHIYMDYVSLIKARLLELKPQNPPEVVLNKMLTSFAASGKIPSAVLEISMLQRYEYLNHFLPTLLSPRVLPSVPDIKMKFIEALKLAGKIPKDLYEKYEKDCCQKANREDSVQYIEIDLEEEDSQITELSMLFMFQIQDCKTEPSYIMSLKRLLSEFRQKLFTALKQINKSTCQRPIKLFAIEVDSSVRKIVQEVVDCYCCFQFELMNINFSNPFLWDLAHDLQSFPHLHDILYHLLWDRIKSENINSNNVYGLSSLLLRIAMLHPQYTMIQKNSSCCDEILLCDFIFDALPLTTANEINYFCRFSYSYLKFAFHHNTHPHWGQSAASLPLYIPEVLIKKFHFAAVRTIAELRKQFSLQKIAASPSSEITEMVKSTRFQLLLNMAKLTFSEWLMLESKVLPDKDNLELKERCEYTRWCIQYMCNFESVMASNMKMNICCRTIFNGLLSKFSKCASYAQLTFILQDLIEVASKNIQCMGINMPTMPWIFEELKSVLQHRINSKFYALHVSSTLKTFFRVTCDLPPFLLFQNLPFQVYYTLDVTELKSLINYLFRLHNENVFSLPATFTCHILKGFLSSLLHSSHSGKFMKEDKIVQAFLLECPLFITSMIEHWSTVESSIPAISPSPENHLYFTLKNIDMFTAHMTRIFSGHPDRNTIVPDLQKWILGYILMKTKVKCHTVPYPLQDITDFEVIAYAIQFHVALKVAVNKEGTEIEADLINVVKHLIESKQSSYLCPSNYEKSIVKEILSPEAWYHLPAGYLKVLLHVYKETDIKTSSEEVISDWICLILSTLSTCNNQYNNRCSVNPCYHYFTSDGKLCKERYGILDLNFIQNATGIITNILCATPPNYIKLIPKHIVENCDEFLKCFLCQ